jgi:glycosyltransferase involved in cell wall biosynthesis
LTPEQYCWWEVFLTNHQAFTTAALARSINGRIDVYVVEAENEIRKQHGWVNTHQPELVVHSFPQRWVPFILATLREKRDATHVFAGPFGSRRLTLAIMLAVLLRRRVFLLTEPYSPIDKGYLADGSLPLIGWLKSRLRPALYRIYGILLRRGVSGVFAISPLAVRQSTAMGFERGVIHPFGYFVPAPEPRATIPHKGPQLRIIFVGTLNLTKGVDILADASRILEAKGVPVQIDCYGYGDKTRFGLNTDRLRHLGLIPFGKASSVMREYELLVLPSRYDGWGVVVNEALQAGIPVVASDHVGASAMIRHWDCGVVYAGGARELADTLEGLARNPQRIAQMRDACSRIQPILEPAVAGLYLRDILREPNKETQSPWYDVPRHAKGSARG